MSQESTEQLFEEMALDVLDSLGIPQDEAERLIEDFDLEYFEE